MLCEFTVYDDDNFDPDDETCDPDVESDDEDYLENYVFNQEKEFTSRARDARASLKHSLSSEGIAVKELDSWFIDGNKLLYAACFVDQFLNLDTTNFDRVLATLEAEVRERRAYSSCSQTIQDFPTCYRLTQLVGYSITGDSDRARLTATPSKIRTPN